MLFGATGDLAARKILPALFNLMLDGELPGHFRLMGLGRRALVPAEFARHCRDAIAHHSRRGVPEQAWSSFASCLDYLHADLSSPDLYRCLAHAIQRQSAEWGATPAQVFYLAVPPVLFAPIARQLGEQGLSAERTRARIVVEKPLGRDLSSFCQINDVLLGDFQEHQIFRIDHYLGKETVQNVLALRFANPLFEPIWNRNYVDHVAITVAEHTGVDGRGSYYEQAGALRDMVQNHLIQLLCLVAMEPPATYDPEHLRSRKMDVMHAIRPFAAGDVEHGAVRGQYGAGRRDGDTVPAYRDEADVAPDSSVETYAALRLHVDNWRWQGVPFYLRSGKRLAADRSDIAIRFRAVPHCAFPVCEGFNAEPAQIAFQIKPEQGVMLRFRAKEPGHGMRLGPVRMRFSYRETFGRNLPEAYETLLRDVMLGDPTLFMRADLVEAAWRLLQPVIETWETVPAADFPNYAAGTWGPSAGARLMSADGRDWLDPEISG